MARNLKKGKFITIEGPDGAGKTTQAEKIAQYLKSRGKRVISTREPGGTALGEQLRKVLLDPEGSPVHTAEALIYAACRAQLLERMVIPALKEGFTVVCDRFVDSSLAYQGWARGIGINRILQLNKWVIGSCWPDLTILLDVDPTVSLGRLTGGRKDRLESEALEFHQKVREGYMKVREMFPDRIRIIDASQPADEVFRQIVAELEKAGVVE
ncbi:dTMP kinase [Thermosediminibacter litoriperuensis]|uniref:Thymidylate kinase n=1 Tax=Thermosediminibacter litoriperuensis TaxID=291989 RepID=A0A5S5AWQ6_9FIRM|nr:dTMP kinase [Thermosediminibacter litoriperuensis]TYP57392.1 thymidylate kinase [Thermosediminibacter litoriperuensis]